MSKKQKSSDEHLFAGMESDQFPKGQLSEEEAGDVLWHWLAEGAKTIGGFRVCESILTQKDTRKTP